MAVAITEKQRVSLDLKAWVAIGAFLFGVAGAWFSTKAQAQASADSSAATAQAQRELAAEVRALDKRTQRTEDAQAWTKAWMERVEGKIDALASERRGRGR
jgi:hypothetical protein